MPAHPLAAALLLAGLLAQEPARDPWLARLVPLRFEVSTGPEAQHWAALLGRRFAVLDRALLEELRRRSAMPAEAEALAPLAALLPELVARDRFPCFVPLAEPGSPATALPLSIFVEVDPSGSFTTRGLDNHREKLAEAVLDSVEFFYRDGESRVVETSKGEVGGVPSLRVVVETALPDGRTLWTERWTVPGGRRCFTVWGQYDRERRTEGAAAFRDLLAGFEGAVEVPDPYGETPQRQITLPIFVLFLLPFAIVPFVLFRKKARPGAG